MKAMHVTTTRQQHPLGGFERVSRVVKAALTGGAAGALLGTMGGLTGTIIGAVVLAAVNALIAASNFDR